MEWRKESIEEIVEYINAQLNLDRTMKDIEITDFEVNERVIHKRLVRSGYKKINNNYVLENIEVLKKVKDKFKKDGRDTTSSTTEILQDEDVEEVKSEGCHTTCNTTEILQSTEVQIVEPGGLSNIDTTKLSLLLDNLDNLLELVKPKERSIITSKETVVTSLRINKELYGLIKDRSKETGENIGDIVNLALLEFLIK